MHSYFPNLTKGTVKSMSMFLPPFIELSCPYMLLENNKQSSLQALGIACPKWQAVIISFLSEETHACPTT